MAIVGCGTSLHVATAIAGLREASGNGETDAYAASEFTGRRRYDRVVAITRSGTTTEIIRLLRQLETSVPTLVVTAVADSPAAELGDATTVLDFADEESVVQTRFATCALALFRAHLGEDLSPIIREGEAALAEPLPVGSEDAEHVVFLGHAWTMGIAAEAALKLREASLTYAESYPAMEYRHGPISLAGPASFVWVLGTPDPGITADVIATGATARVSVRDAMAELVLVHRVADARAKAKGLDPDHPRHLSRSVVLA